VLKYLGPYRLLRSDLVVVTMCDEFLVSRESLRRLIDGILSINPGTRVKKTVFRPRPTGDVEGRKVFLTSTAPSRVVDIQAEHLPVEYGARVVGTSPNLADREKLEDDLEGSAGADILVTELKAAAVDTVSVLAESRGQEVVYLENLPVALEGNLEEEVDRLEELAESRFEERSG
jgi:cyclic 2,3-diphosphoglycerate synthase